MADNIQNSSGGGFNLTGEEELTNEEDVFAAQDAQALAPSSEEDPKALSEIQLKTKLSEREDRIAERSALAESDAQAQLSKLDMAQGLSRTGLSIEKGALSKAEAEHGKDESDRRELLAAVAERKRVKGLGRDLQSGIGKLKAADRIIKQQYSEAKLKLKKETAEARLEAETKFTNINNQINELRAKDPGQPIFSSSWGIAAALVGSIRQGMFGGANTAMSMLNKMVDQAAKQQMANIKNLQEQSTSAGKLVNGIIKGASSDQKLLSDLYKANLKDVDDSMKDLIKQYEIKLKQNEDLTLATAVSELVNKSINSDVSADSRIANGYHKLARVVNEGGKYEQEIRERQRSAGGALQPTKSEIIKGKEAYKRMSTAMNSLKAYSGIVYSLKDIFKEHIANGSIGTDTWDRFKAQGVNYLPTFLRSAKASKIKTLTAKINAAIFAEINKTQTRISDADRKGYSGFYGDPADHPEMLADRITNLLKQTVEQARDVMLGAADVNIFPSEEGISQVLFALPNAEAYTSDPLLASTLSMLREEAAILYGSSRVGYTGGVKYGGIPEPFQTGEAAPKTEDSGFILSDFVLDLFGNKEDKP